MKTAVSIPDDIFSSADRLAKQLQMSRSELYARAVKRYVAECRHTGVKEKLDEVYRFEAKSVDPAVMNAQAASITKEKW